MSCAVACRSSRAQRVTSAISAPSDRWEGIAIVMRIRSMTMCLLRSGTGRKPQETAHFPELVPTFDGSPLGAAPDLVAAEVRPQRVGQRFRLLVRHEVPALRDLLAAHARETSVAQARDVLVEGRTRVGVAPQVQHR